MCEACHPSQHVGMGCGCHRGNLRTGWLLVNSRLNTQDCSQHRHPDQNDFRSLQVFLGGHLSGPRLFQLTGPAGCWEGQAAPVLLALLSRELRRRLGSPSRCPPAERKPASPEVPHQQSARCQTALSPGPVPYLGMETSGQQDGLWTHIIWK